MDISMIMVIVTLIIRSSDTTALWKEKAKVTSFLSGLASTSASVGSYKYNIL